MMAQRLVCESTLFAAGIAVSGPLNVAPDTCPAGVGKRVLAIHGTADDRVPIAGGHGTEGASRAAYSSEEQSAAVFRRSGATYQLITLEGVGHTFADLDTKMQGSEGTSIGEKALQFFQLSSR